VHGNWLDVDRRLAAWTQHRRHWPVQGDGGNGLPAYLEVVARLGRQPPSIAHGDDPSVMGADGRRSQDDVGICGAPYANCAPEQEDAVLPFRNHPD